MRGCSGMYIALCASLTPDRFFRSFKDLIAIPIDVLELPVKLPIYCTSINFCGVQIFVDSQRFELRLQVTSTTIIYLS